MKRSSDALPGPGNYDIDGELGRSGPHFSLSPKRRDKRGNKSTNKLPGPGDYNPSSSFTKKSAPGVSFGSNERFHTRRNTNSSKVMNDFSNAKSLFESISSTQDSRKVNFHLNKFDF